jgi:transcriptional regulator with XRE-family HTH domain
MLASTMGFKMRERRGELGFSLRELARRTDLTASFLSQVENNKTSLSLESLRRIAEALDVPLFYFLDQEPEPALEPAVDFSQASSSNQDYSPVVHPSHRPRLYLPLSGVTYEKLIPDTGRKMEALCGRLAPGTANVARKLRQPTEEFIYVLEGELLVELISGTHVLGSGAAIYFEGDDLIALQCASIDRDAVWISVLTPGIF